VDGGGLVYIERIRLEEEDELFVKNHCMETMDGKDEQ
jgi:hypothetical protein